LEKIKGTQNNPHLTDAEKRELEKMRKEAERKIKEIEDALRAAGLL